MTTHESRLKITLIEDVVRGAARISSALGGIERQAASFGAPFRSLVGQAVAFGGAYFGVSEGLKSTAGAALEFETAFADVRKVVDANEEQFENLRRTIRQMSTELPIAANDIAALFAAAGESGIATGDLKQFAEMAARVGIAFDMSAGEAGESLAKLKTQLGLTVGETGDMADAINHLSNNMASKAKDITNYMLRVGALAEMGGFTKEQIAGIGSAMIAAGAEAEVAGTAMQNVVKALTKGVSAKKGQKEVAEALGLDLPQLAKDMQKDAPKALRKVLRAIAKTPKDRHIALLSDFFGDEAKAFAPLIGNIGLLEQALDSVSDKTKYSGSAFKEYVQRANTTANALEIIQNKIANRFWMMGDAMLPTIKEAAEGIGYVLDTLDNRVSIFDEVQTGIQGFAQGLGYGGIREVIEDLGDLFFGKIDPQAGDQLGRVFMQAKEWGASIRELNAALKENPIAQFFADLAPYALQILLWGAGITMLAGTIRTLASALMFLSGATAIIGALKTVGSIADVVSGGTFPKGEGGKGGKKGGGSANVSGTGTAAAGSIATWFKGLGIAAAPGLMSDAMSFTPGDTFEDQVRLQKEYKNDLRRIFGLIPDEKGVTGLDRFLWGKAAEPDFDARAHFGIETKASGSPEAAPAGKVGDKAVVPPGSEGGKPDGGSDQAASGFMSWFRSWWETSAPVKAPDPVPPISAPVIPPVPPSPVMPTGSDETSGISKPVTIDAPSIDAMTQPRGTQDVNVTNPRPAPNINLSLIFHAHGVTNPEELANQVSSRVSQQIRDQVAGIYADTGYGVA